LDKSHTIVYKTDNFLIIKLLAPGDENLFGKQYENYLIVRMIDKSHFVGGYFHWAGKRFVGTEDNWSFGYDLGDTRVRAMEPADLLSTHREVREHQHVPGPSPARDLLGECESHWSQELL